MAYPSSSEKKNQPRTDGLTPGPLTVAYPTDEIERFAVL